MTAAERDPRRRAPRARRRGRRPGGADTRDALLTAARTEFAERGFDGATVRVIADRAGVDPAMVNHWFGGKEALFTAALDLPIDPSTLVAEVVPGDPSTWASGSSSASSRSGTTPAAVAGSPHSSAASRATRPPPR